MNSNINATDKVELMHSYNCQFEDYYKAVCALAVKHNAIGVPKRELVMADYDFELTHIDCAKKYVRGLN